MTITISNQQPTELSAVYIPRVAGDYDPIELLRSTIVKPLMTPMNSNHPLSITMTPPNTNTPIDMDEDKITELIAATLTDATNPDAEKEAKSLLYQGLIHYYPSTHQLTNELFAVQAGAKHKYPAPNPPMVTYTAQTDIIPAAKKMLTGNNQQASPVDGEEFFTSIAFTYHPETLGFYFADTIAFDEFKSWLANQVSIIAANLPSDTNRLLQQFSQSNLNGLVEGLVLRSDDDDALEDYSFARVIIHYLMKYHDVVNSSQFGIMPFHVSELFLPRSIVFVNVERHARSQARKINNEWDLINQSTKSPLNLISKKNLTSLTALQRSTKKARRQAATSSSNKLSQVGRSAKIRFRKKRPPAIDISKQIIRVIARMGKTNKSMNVFNSVKTSFLKANRRDPDDWNKPGKIISKQYLPDIHIYLDTSGSISEENYRGTVMMLIRLAKKLNVNLYFSSFSHVLSQEAVLHVKDRPITKIWEEFRRIPKVNGGTDYLQVWEYINRSRARKRRFNLIITDFEYYAPPSHFEHPKNLYYAPIADSSWNSIVRAAEDFSRTVQHMEPKIHQRLLGVIV